MSNAEPENPFARFLRTMEMLPPSPGLVFHGLPDASGHAAGGTMYGVAATSRNPRVATENFTSAALGCIMTRTGRDISPLSAQKSEQETVLLPGIVLLPVMSWRDEALDLTVMLFEELDPNADSSGTDRAAAVERLRSEIDARLLAAWHDAPLVITSPGKFTAPLPLQ